MKNRQKLRIIQIYLPSNTHTLADHQHRLKIQQKILDLILEAKSKNYHHIVMGDFNIDIKRKYSSSRQKRYQYFLTQLENLGLMNNLKIFNQSYPSTFFSTNSSSSLDYLFSSSSLTHDLTFSTSLNTYSYNYESDHTPLVSFFYKNNIFHQKSNASLKQKKLTKTKFLYDKTSKETWNNFSSKLDNLISQNPF